MITTATPAVAASTNSSFQPKKNHPKQHPHPHLVILYGLTTALCLYMVLWILILPGSWLMGRDDVVPWHTHYIVPLLERQTWVAVETVTKYQGHTAIHLTHLLPGVIWAGAIPFQLHGGYKKAYPRWHRRIGYAFFTCVLLMTVGILIILQRKLTFDHFFQDLEDASNSNNNFWNHDTIRIHAPIYLMTIWFLWTAGQAWIAIAMRSPKQQRSVDNIANHQKWMIRHMASGLWIAIQRVLLTTLFPLYFQWMDVTIMTRAIQKQTFGDAAFLATFLSLILGEYAISLLPPPQQLRQPGPFLSQPNKTK